MQGSPARGWIGFQIGWPLRHCEPSFVAIVAAIRGWRPFIVNAVSSRRTGLVGNTKPPRKTVLAMLGAWAQ
jgi:hypothetical protein